MPWWGWPFGPGVHAGSHVLQVLLASHGCTGKGACWEVFPMSCFQNQAAKSPPQKHSGHTSSGAGPPWLPISGTWEGPGGECSSSYRSFHKVCPGICHQDPDCPNDCQNTMGQVHCPLWATQKDPHGSRMKLQESVGGWPLLADGTWKVQTSLYHL